MSSTLRAGQFMAPHAHNLLRQSRRKTNLIAHKSCQFQGMTNYRLRMWTVKLYMYSECQKYESSWY